MKNDKCISINEILEKLKDKGRITDRIQTIDDELHRQREMLKEYNAERDVIEQITQELQQSTPKAILAYISGQRQRKIDKSLKKYHQAVIKCEDLRRALELLEYERKVLSNKPELLIDYDAMLRRAIRMKEIQLTDTDKKFSSGLYAIDQDIAAAKNRLYSHNKMLDTSEKAVNGINVLLGLLDIDELKRIDARTSQYSRSVSVLKKRYWRKAKIKAAHASEMINQFYNSYISYYSGKLKTNRVDTFFDFLEVFANHKISHDGVDRAYESANSHLQFNLDDLSKAIQHLRSAKNNLSDKIYALQHKRQQFIIEYA